MTFQLFSGKRVDDLTGDDLVRLLDVPEGWFVEYKQAPCAPKDYAKAVSAFANDRGGWVIVGVTQDRISRKPSGAPGVPTADVARLLDSVRDGVSQNLSPCPTFEVGAVAGPLNELGLPADRSLLVIHAPESGNTPHIHSSGRVYRRQGDKSMAVEITNRGELDELYARTSRLKRRLDKLLNRGFDERWAEAFDMPWVHCALVPSASNSSTRKHIGFDKFRAVVSASASEGMVLPDSHASPLGYVATNHSSQTAADGPAVSLEYGLDGSIYLSLPLSIGTLADPEDVEFLRCTEGMRFRSLLEQRRLRDASVLDGSYIVAALMGLHARARAVLQEAQMAGAYLYRVRCWNLFRRVPYFRSTSYIDWCEGHTIPVVRHGRITLPGRDWDRLEEIQAQYAITGAAGRVLLAVGVPETLIPAIVSETIAAVATFRSA